MTTSAVSSGRSVVTSAVARQGPGGKSDTIRSSTPDTFVTRALAVAVPRVVTSGKVTFPGAIVAGAGASSQVQVSRFTTCPSLQRGSSRQTQAPVWGSITLGGGQLDGGGSQRPVSGFTTLGGEQGGGSQRPVSGFGVHGPHPSLVQVLPGGVGMSQRTPGGHLSPHTPVAGFTTQGVVSSHALVTGSQPGLGGVVPT